MAGLLSTLQHRLNDPSIPWKTVVAVSVLAGEAFEGYVGCVAGSQTRCWACPRGLRELT